jgi:proteasome lid subunit RPN8/RPN11
VLFKADSLEAAIKLAEQGARAYCSKAMTQASSVEAMPYFLAKASTPRMRRTASLPCFACIGWHSSPMCLPAFSALARRANYVRRIIFFASARLTIIWLLSLQGSLTPSMQLHGKCRQMPLFRP